MKKERIEQYEKMLGKRDGELSSFVKPSASGDAEVDHQRMARYVTEMYYKKLVDANRKLKRFESFIEVEYVNTHVEATREYNIQGKSIIFIDSSSMLFLWMMNKANIYRSYLTKRQSRKLHIEIFLYFTTLYQRSVYPFVYPRPKTPPHQKLELYQLLVHATEVQELFMLAHEIAHVMINNDVRLQEKLKNFSMNDFLLSSSESLFENNESFKTELYADSLAFDMVLNVYDLERNNKENTRFVSTFIFLFIRYIMWQRLVALEEINDSEFTLWFLRNSSIRRKINKVYEKWGPPTFLLDLFDEYLEVLLEPAALDAKEVLEKLKKLKKSPL